MLRITSTLVLATLVLATVAGRAQPAHAQHPARDQPQAPGPAAAQPPRPAIELKIIAGYAGFIDEEMVDHTAIGGAVRWLVTPRVGVEMELLHLRGPGEDRDWLFVPALSWDLRARGHAIPYIVGGAGWVRTTLPVGTGLYTSSSWTGGGGGGVRFVLSPATTLSVEARLGSEPLTRITAAFGWQLRPRR